MNDYFNNKELFKEELEKRVHNLYLKDINNSTPREIYNSLSKMVMDYLSTDWIDSSKLKDVKGTKTVYYFSMEFLIGRQTLSNIEAINKKEIIEEGLKDYNLDLNNILNVEKDPGLGNGGLGRLAACYMDSLASLGYSAVGETIRYQYGLFRQKIKNGYQEERPDNWLSDSFSYEIRREEEAIEIPLYGYVSYENNKRVYHPSMYIKAVPYDVPIVGYRNHFINELRIWNAEPAKKYPENISAIKYEEDIRKICGFLYPDDSSDEGKRLRLTQQYFFSSAGINSIIKNEIKKYGTLDNLYDHAIFHLNDTHPTILIAELIRILIDEYDYEWDDAFEIAKKSCFYTNHTLLREAMETWDRDLMRNLLPRIVEIIDEINRRFVDGLYSIGYKKDFCDKVAIIKDNRVHMANLASHVSTKINGVARLHSELLKNNELKEFSHLYKDKFTNVTNGISTRRFLINSNKGLVNLYDKHLGNKWREDFNNLSLLKDKIDDNLIDEFIEIKNQNKEILANYINETHKSFINKIDSSFIFDVQVKRLHEYKRQLLNALHIIYLYNRIKNDSEFRANYEPHCFIFGAKAASGYYFAKKVIKLINTLSTLIDKDEVVSKYLRVVFIENYGVSIAEIINPAIDISEQISLASYEASGTGNMKAMMNGAITIGTMDGANVEINELVGNDNMFVFGLSKDEVLSLRSSYKPYDIYSKDKVIRETVDFLKSDVFSKEERDQFIDIYNRLVNDDNYMILKDFNSYLNAQERINNLYKNKKEFYKSCLINALSSSFFSSDRSIETYAKEIWNVNKIK